MMLALLGAIVVLGGGSYALRLVLARGEGAHRSPGAGRPASAEHFGSHPPVAAESQVGGYVPAPRAGQELPAALRRRALALISDGRREEAVRVVRDRLRSDDARARRIVAGLGEPDATGGPAPGVTPG